jgi:hypothetical protein
MKEHERMTWADLPKDFSIEQFEEFLVRVRREIALDRALASKRAETEPPHTDG